MPKLEKSCITRRWLAFTRAHVPREAAEGEFSKTVDVAFVRIPGNGVHGDIIAWHKNGHYYILIRSKGDDGEKTVEEWKEELPQKAFGVLWKSAEGSRLRKECGFRELSGCIMKVSTYDLGLPDFTPKIVECDFETVGQSASFILPESMRGAVDVTDDPRFSEINLARNPEAAREAF